MQQKGRNNSKGFGVRLAATRILLMVFIGLSLPSSGNASVRIAGSSAIVENSHYECSIDWDSGVRITRLINKDTGADCLLSDCSALPFLVVAEGRRVAPDLFKVVSVSRDRGRLRLELACAEPAIRAQLQFKAGDGADLLMILSLTNAGASAIKIRTWFPLFAGLQIGAELEDDHYLTSIWDGTTASNSPTKVAGVYGAYGAHLQLTAVYDKKGGGLLVYPRDSKGDIKILGFAKTGDAPLGTSGPGKPEGYTYHLDYMAPEYRVDWDRDFAVARGSGIAVEYLERELSPGATHSYPETVIGVFRGDWHDAMDRYVKWVRSWYRPVKDVPEWYRNTFLIRTAHPAWGAFGGYHPKDKFVAGDHMTKDEMLQIAFWWGAPKLTADEKEKVNPLRGTYPWYYFAEGDYAYNDEWGGLRAFQDEVKKIHGKGGRLELYLEGFGVSRLSAIGREHGDEWTVRSADGRPVTYPVDGPLTDWLTMCAQSTGWQDYIAGVCRRLVRDLGVDGIYLDRTLAAYPCYSIQHQHAPSPLDGSAELYRKIRRAIRLENPEVVLRGEQLGSEYFSQFCDGGWSHSLNVESLDVLKAINPTGIDLFRFYFPSYKMIFIPSYEGKDGSFSCYAKALFNGAGVLVIDSGSPAIIAYVNRIAGIMRENRDAFNTMHPEALIPTLNDTVFSNRFPGNNKVVYTFFNTGASVENSEVLAVKHKQGVHYVDLLNHREVDAKTHLAFDNLTLSLGKEDAACVAQFPKALTVQLSGTSLTGTLTRPIQSPRVKLLDVTRVNGVASSTKIDEAVPAGGVFHFDVLEGEECVVQLFDGDILVDEMILPIVAGAHNWAVNGDLESWAPDSFAPSNPWYSKAVQPTGTVISYRSPYNMAFSDGSGSWLTGWAADGYGFDYGTSNYIKAASGNRFVRLPGNQAGGGGFYSAWTLTAGRQYKLQSSIAGDLYNGPNIKSLRALIQYSGGGTIASSTFNWDGAGKVGAGLPYGSDPGWERHEIVFTPGFGTVFISFDDVTVGGSDNGGALVDNIILSASP